MRSKKSSLLPQRQAPTADSVELESVAPVTSAGQESGGEPAGALSPEATLPADGGEPVSVVPAGASLEDLARDINEAHAQVDGAVLTALEHACRVGQKLLEAKEKVGHGNWGKWISENLEFTERTAQQYMKVAREWDSLEAFPKRASEMSIRGTLALLKGAKGADSPEPSETRNAAGAEGGRGSTDDVPTGAPSREEELVTEPAPGETSDPPHELPPPEPVHEAPAPMPFTAEEPVFHLAAKAGGNDATLQVATATHRATFDELERACNNCCDLLAALPPTFEKVDRRYNLVLDLLDPAPEELECLAPQLSAEQVEYLGWFRLEVGRRLDLLDPEGLPGGQQESAAVADPATADG
jgi:hypothetical protein